MKIETNKYVAMEYTLTSDSGDIIDKSLPQQPLNFVFGKGQIIPGLESELQNMIAGDSKKVTVEAKDGYGEVNPELFHDIPSSHFSDDINMEVGMSFQTTTPHGPMRFIVSEIKEDSIVANLNHPLAGQKLHFDVKIEEVRNATDAEINPPSTNDSDCDGSHSCSSCSSCDDDNCC